MAKIQFKSKRPGRGRQRAYKMRISGGLVKQLGLQMYAGAVPAIAELVSNAWDAMAKNVWINIPLDRPLQEDDIIEVRDDGHGMKYAECNDEYLLIGRDRRAEEGDHSRRYGDLEPRRVQARKGIGKLAGFGIAYLIEVRTVAGGEVSHFEMDYDQIVRSRKFIDERGYAPDPLPDDGTKMDERPGTTIRLSRLKITRAIPLDQFRRGMARRFTVLSRDFRVFVNDDEVLKEEREFEFRFPEGKGTWETVELPSKQNIKWWAGFTRTPIDDENARGFVVYVRGKMAQPPFFFGLSGGAWGQHGMQYLTGEIVADILDETEGVDAIATDRGGIRWEEPTAAPLMEWGLRKVRDLLEEWAKKRREKKQHSAKVQQYLELASRLPEREQRIFHSFVDRITSIPQIDKDEEGREILDDLVEFGYHALTNRAFLDVIRQINAASPEDRERFAEALAEWDIIEAVTTARLVRGRVELIRKFRKMIKEEVREKPDMQDYLKKYPWLIDPSWTMLVHEQSLDRLLHDQFGVPKSECEERSDRVDFFCMGDKYLTAHVVDLKRPGLTIGQKELDQVRDYVLFLRRRLIESSTDPKHRRQTVGGVLVYSKIRDEDSLLAKSLQEGNVVQLREWLNLLTTAEVLHEDYLRVIKERAPADDPRIKEIDIPPGPDMPPEPGA